MQPVRPIGHIAHDLHMLAINIGYRMRQSRTATPYLCWADDDGCVYLAQATCARALGVLRNAPEQRVNTYCKPRPGAFPLSATDITADLLDARDGYVNRQLQQATEVA